MKNDIIELTRKNDIKGVKKFIAEGGDINFQNEWGYTALMIASYWNHPAIVKLLIDAGAKLDLQNEKGETALFISIMDMKIDIAEILLKSGASMGAYYAEQLVRRSLLGKTKLIELLIKCKENESARDIVIYFNEKAKQEARDEFVNTAIFLLPPILISLFFLIIGILKYYHIIN